MTNPTTPPIDRAKQALDLIMDIACERRDWALPEPQALFSRETAIKAMLAFADAVSNEAAEMIAGAMNDTGEDNQEQQNEE